MKYKTNNLKISDHLLSITWLLLLILPNNNLLFFFVPISFILLLKFNNSSKYKLDVLIILMIVSLIITLFLNYGKSYAIIKDVFRVIALIIILTSFARLKGGVIIKQYIVIAALFLIISQFAFALKITPIMDLIKTYYPMEDEGNLYIRLENYSFSNFGIQRLGGIYYNPNQYARYIELVLIALLCEFRQFRRTELLIIFPLIVLSIAATGSRTSFLVFLFILLFFLYFNKLFTPKKIILLSVATLGVLSYLIISTNFADLRMLKVSEGLDSSFNTKLNVLMDYFAENISILSLLFGNISGMVLIIKYNIGILGTDFDIGNIIVYYGFVFLIILGIFLTKVYKKYSNKYKIIFPILLWMFSSAIITNYRTAPIFFLMLGLYYRRSLIEGKS